jgi:UDP-N-acetylmuramate--alanine ligase
MGRATYLVAEADESDGSFLHLTPVIAIITNIDAEHLDHYGTHEKVKTAFAEFANRVPFYGLVVACLDHPHVQAILPRIEKRIATYGLTAQADYRARNPVVDGLSTRFELVRRGKPAGSYTVRMPGIHNVLNALAVIAVCDELEVPEDVTRKALAEFGGVQRRFTIIGESKAVGETTSGAPAQGVTIVDDYGHHPAEVQATLEAAQRAYGRRLVVAFQPHRYTRTQFCFEELTRAFNRADVLLLADVYAAGEQPIAGATSEALAQAIRAHGHRDVTWVGPRAEVAKAIADRAQPGDIVITLGAGDITRVGPELLSMLNAKAEAAP